MNNSKKSCKIIFHIDLNCFFCTVAMIKNPSLRGKKFAIGRENSFKGVISTASYEARKEGIHAGMAISEAYKILPSLLIVSCDFNDIRMYHNLFVNFLKEYSSLVEVASVDEAYVDMTELSKTKYPLDIANEIQSKLLKLYNLPCSIGIAPTLFLAKMASDLKKPLGIQVIRKRESEKILFPLSVKEIFGIGKKTFPKLIDNNILTIGNFLDEKNKEKVISLVGEKTLNYVSSAVGGLTSDVVDPERYSDSQSISASQTFDRLLMCEADVLVELHNLTKDLVSKMKKKDYYTKTVGICLRDSSFHTITRCKTITYSNDLYLIFDEITTLVEENYHNEVLRLVGVFFKNLVKKEDIPQEYNLFTYENIMDKNIRLNIIVSDLQKKFGDKINKGIKVSSNKKQFD